MSEIYGAFIEWLREQGWVVENGGVGTLRRSAEVRHFSFYAWRGSVKQRRGPLFEVQFAASFLRSKDSSEDCSDLVNIWCSYRSKSGDWYNTPVTLRSFSLLDPLVFDQILEYFAFHEGNADPVANHVAEMC